MTMHRLTTETVDGMDRPALLAALGAILSPSTLSDFDAASAEQLRDTLKAARDQLADYNAMGFEDMAAT